MTVALWLISRVLPTRWLPVLVLGCLLANLYRKAVAAALSRKLDDVTGSAPFPATASVAPPIFVCRLHPERRFEHDVAIAIS
jgi:hypothetical protein